MEKFANIACISMVILIIALLYKLLATFGISMLINYDISPSAHNITWFIAFDMCVATAISWASLTSDYSRNCPNIKTSIHRLSRGYFMSALLAMSLGIVTAAISVGTGNGISVDPTQCLAEFGFGLISVIVFFEPLTITNVLGLYSTALSVMNIFPNVNFKKTVLFLGTIVAIAALWSGLLANFTTFVGAAFLPLFGIVIADYYVIQKSDYDSEQILGKDKSSKYYYTKGFNPIAIECYFVSVAASVYWSKIDPPSFGSTIISLDFSFVIYILVHKLLFKKFLSEYGEVENF
jgi:purine-cytosine permease-like protein